MSTLPKKILVANRGEIAVRVMRACRELGIATVAVYSQADEQALHVRMADEAYLVGPAPSAQSYLRAEVILDVVRQSGADAIHPGYGFLSENAGFAQQVLDSGITWIGPSPSAIQSMGSKTESRARMVAAGVPVVPGGTEAIPNAQEAQRIADEMGYPVMIKAAAGGGGKGMREVTNAEDLQTAFQSAQSEARNSFGDDDVYIEKRIIRPRHVEVQVLADQHGNVVHVFERDCSIQRRHQKVVEESPCPVILEETRQKMTQVAIQAARAVEYEGAGTVEFLLAEDQSFYFLEMNTRLQVEHPITEMVTGIDLVQAQIRVASGEPLAFTQDDIIQQGHSIECRIYAEDAQNNWAPSPGKLLSYHEPSGPWIRVDSGIGEGGEVTVFYDPMISKLIVWGHDRQDAIRRMRRALHEYCILGIQTSIPFFQALLDDEEFLSGIYDTGYLTPEKMTSLTQVDSGVADEVLAAIAILALERDLAKKPTQQTSSGSKWKWAHRLRQ